MAEIRLATWDVYKLQIHEINIDKLPIKWCRISATIEWWLEVTKFFPDTPWFVNRSQNITNTQAGMATPIPSHTCHVEESTPST